MNLSKSTWACLVLIILALFRASQLHREAIAQLSTIVIQNDNGVPEIASSQQPTLRFQGQENDQTLLDDKNSDLFYFVQVCPFYEILFYLRRNHRHQVTYAFQDNSSQQYL